MVAREARSQYVTSPYLEKELSVSVGSVSTFGLPLMPLESDTWPFCSTRMPATALSWGGHDAHGTLSLPSTFEFPFMMLSPPEVTAAPMLICSGRIVPKSPMRWLAPPPRRPPARLWLSWPVISMKYSSSFGLYSVPLNFPVLLRAGVALQVRVLFAPGYMPSALKVVVLFGQARMTSFTPSSATPNDAWTRRVFSATRCSCVPENSAPATSAPTTTSATIAMASAIPRSFFRTCFIDRSLVDIVPRAPRLTGTARSAGCSAAPPEW